MSPRSISVLSGAALTAIGATATIAATPTIFLDYSNVIATGSTIILNRLPIQKSDGTIIY